MIYTKWSNPIGCYALAKNCDWFRQITPESNLTRVSLLVEWTRGTYSEGRIELRNLQFLNKMLEKSSKVFVIRSAQWAEKLGCCLEYCRSWKIRSENLRLRSTWRPFDSSFERNGTVEICVLCGRWFSNQFETVSETPFSWDAVDRELYFARFCAVNWTGTFASESKVWFFAFLNINQCVKIFLPLRKVEFIKRINLINVLFISFVKEWFSAY